jgi:hypothetical protein
MTVSVWLTKVVFYQVEARVHASGDHGDAAI